MGYIKSDHIRKFAIGKKIKDLTQSDDGLITLVFTNGERLTIQRVKSLPPHGRRMGKLSKAQKSWETQKTRKTNPMGEAADDALDREMAEFEIECDWDSAFDEGDNLQASPSFGSIHKRIPTPPKCKYCGTTGLHWIQNNGKWRLASKGGKIHSCKQRLQFHHVLKSFGGLHNFTHWKVGDGMKVGKEEPHDDERGYIIDRIAIVQDPKDKRAFHICYFDYTGKCRGSQHVQLVKP